MPVLLKPRNSRRGKLRGTLGDASGHFEGDFEGLPPRIGQLQTQLQSAPGTFVGFYAAAQAPNRTGTLAATTASHTMGPASVIVKPVPTIKHLQGKPGQLTHLSAWVSYHTPADLRYTRVSGTGPAGETLGVTTGALSYDGSSPAATGPWVVEVGPETATTRLADVPEIFFLVGYAEVEELGIYILDPNNRTARGDLWWQTGARLQAFNGGNWTPQQPVTLTVTSGTLPTGLTFDAATARLVWTGANITGAHHTATVQLAVGFETKSFRVRVLRPTMICSSNAAGLPAVLAGITVRAPGTDVWNGIAPGGTSTGQSLIQTGTSGNDDATPRVILFDNELIPRNDWFIGDASNITKFRYMYICGVPRNPTTGTGGATQLGAAYVSGTQTIELFAVQRYRSLHFKNLKLGNAGMVTSPQESAFPTRWTIQKVDWLARNPDVDGSNVENGATWAPNAFPDAVNDFRFHCVNCRMLQGGSSFGLHHCFYLETNGYTFGDFNNLQLNGGNKCSMIQTVLGHVRIRNSYISFCATPLDPYASPYWAAEMIDPHALGEMVAYNNELIGGRDATQASRGGTQNAQMAFLSNRRPAKGSNTPNYASLSWSAPASTGGPTSPRLGSFPTGPATFANPAFWSAVNAGGPNNPDNAYLFRHFYSYNTVRHAEPTPNKTNIMRIDGTHPSEPQTAQTTPTYMLGVPPGWIDRCVVWLMNNNYESWTAAQADTGPTGTAFERYDSQNITMVEDGTKMASRTVTLDDSQVGTVRIRLSTGGLHEASANVKTRIGWVGISPPSGFDTFAELQTVLLTPSSWTEDPVKWPPAKWPQTATGQGPHPELATLEATNGVSRIVNVGGHKYSDQPGNAFVVPPNWFMR